MLGGDGCAFVKPMGKLYYNMTIPYVSVVVALAVGVSKGLRLSAGPLHPTGGCWIVVARLNMRSGELGYAIVCLLVLSLVVSMAVFGWRVFDRVEISQQVSIEAER